MKALKRGGDWSTWKSDLQDLIDFNCLTEDQVKQILCCKLQGEAYAHYKSMPEKKASASAIWKWMDDCFINLMHCMTLKTRLMKMVQWPGQSVENYKSSLLNCALRAHLFISTSRGKRRSRKRALSRGEDPWKRGWVKSIPGTDLWGLVN